LWSDISEIRKLFFRELKGAIFFYQEHHLLINIETFFPIEVITLIFKFSKKCFLIVDCLDLIFIFFEPQIDLTEDSEVEHRSQLGQDNCQEKFYAGCR